jgi:hypothetical protein
MKNIYKFLVLILTVGVSACSDSDEPSEDTGALSVVETSVSFPQAGGNDGFIKVNLTDGYTATSSQNWCTLDIEKDVIKVSAVANPQLGSRAALVTVASGNQRKEVAVYQYGVIMTVEQTELFFDSNDGPENPQKVKISANSTPTVTVADPWVTATIIEDTLTVYCNNFPTDERSTTVTVTVGEVETVITVTQVFSVAYEDYLGEWTMTGTDIITGEEITFPDIVITENVSGQSYYVDGWYASTFYVGMRFVMEYDPQTGGVTVKGLQYAGSYDYSAIYFVAAMIYGGSLDYISNDVDPALKGRIKSGKINWEYQSIYDDYYGSNYRVAGMCFFLPFENYYDDYILNNAVLTKK